MKTEKLTIESLPIGEDWEQINFLIDEVNRLRGENMALRRALVREEFGLRGVNILSRDQAGRILLRMEREHFRLLPSNPEKASLICDELLSLRRQYPEWKELQKKAEEKVFQEGGF